MIMLLCLGYIVVGLVLATFAYFIVFTDKELGWHSEKPIHPNREIWYAFLNIVLCIAIGVSWMLWLPLLWLHNYREAVQKYNQERYGDE